MARILFLSEAYTVHDRRFLAKLADTPHTVWFLSRMPHRTGPDLPPLPEKIKRLPPLSDRPGSWSLRDWYEGVHKVREILASIQPEVIHAGPLPTGSLLAALAGAHPLLAMSWGSDLLTQARGLRWESWAVRYALRHSDMAAADCRVVQNRIHALSHLQMEDICVFPWGVNLKQFYPAPDEMTLRSLHHLTNEPLILYTRGFEPIHDPLLFLQALTSVVRERPNTRAWMLGDGSLRPAVEAYIRTHDLAKAVSLMGRISNDLLPNYFRAADLYVSTTRSDGSSISLLEAMACGRSVIAVNAYGNPEWIREGENGWLYPPNDSAALARRIIQTIDDVALRERMGHANAALTRQRADWDSNFQILLGAYDRLLNRRRPEPVHERGPIHAGI